MSERPDISRRDFVRGRFAKAPSNPAPLVMRYPRSADEVSMISSEVASRQTIPVLRPPGAVDEVTFLAECTRCSECITACPHDAIVHAPDRMRQAAGTPMIDADNQPCVMCADFPCIAACEPNVLTVLVPKAMGTAKVIAQTCLAYHGTTCTVCSEQCPVEGAIDVTNGKPSVNEEVCTGCGVCRYVCPSVENAILLMPTFARSPGRGNREH
ncbi:MAG: 4Fe-4S dicluster domain-containing protein [Aeoliella sp.]